MSEHRFQHELRVAGRSLDGTLMPYGTPTTIAGIGREMFKPGAFRELPGQIALNLQHDPQVIVVPAADLIDGADALRVHAELDERGAASRLVRRGTLSGLSVEFTAMQEHREGDLRVIEVARLDGGALVDQGAYDTAVVEVRATVGEWLNARIDYGKRLGCECQGPTCDAVQFDPGSLDGLDDDDEEVLAIGGDGFASLVGSKRRGTLKFRLDDDGVEIGLSEANTPAAQNLIRTARAGDLYARPIIDDEKSVSVIQGLTRVYSKAVWKAVLIKATLVTQGLVAAEIDDDAADDDATPRMRRWR